LQGKVCEPFIAAKLKRITAPEQFVALRETQLASAVMRYAAGAGQNQQCEQTAQRHVY
jgi:hypothetical protein